MGFDFHISFSTREKTQPYAFDLYQSAQKEGKFQIKLGSKFYSIHTQNKEERSAIKQILQKAMEDKPLRSVEDLSKNIRSLSFVQNVRTHQIHQLGITSLVGHSPLMGEWSKQDEELKHTAAELYWKKRVIDGSEDDQEGFLTFLQFNAQYDPAIDNDHNRLVNSFRLAIKTRNKDQFLELFASLPLGVVGVINHGDGLKAFPQPKLRIPEKTKLTESDLIQLEQYMKDIQFSGIVCISDSEGNAHTLSSGDHSPSNVPFAMHSIGKMFTGMLAMKMIEGDFIPEKALDEPIQLEKKVLDQLPKKIREHLTKKGAPTFREIMLHQGGLGDYLSNYEAAIQQALDEKKQPPKIYTPEDLIQYAETEIYEIKEGESHYSNLGLLLVGLSIQYHYNKKLNEEMENADYTPYSEILHQHVIEPAALSSFSITRPKDGCYNKLHPAAAYIEGGPAGGYWITGSDLLKFGEWTAKQCKDEAFFELVTKYGGEFQPERELRNEKDEEFKPEELSHGGQIDSATSFLGTFLPNGITIDILSNRPFQAAVLEGAIKDHILS